MSLFTRNIILVSVSTFMLCCFIIFVLVTSIMKAKKDKKYAQIVDGMNVIDINSLELRIEASRIKQYKHQNYLLIIYKGNDNDCNFIKNYPHIYEFLKVALRIKDDDEVKWGPDYTTNQQCIYNYNLHRLKGDLGLECKIELVRTPGIPNTYRGTAQDNQKLNQYIRDCYNRLISNEKKSYFSFVFEDIFGVGKLKVV